jgi:hypothetical protein
LPLTFSEIISFSRVAARIKPQPGLRSRWSSKKR